MAVCYLLMGCKILLLFPWHIMQSFKTYFYNVSTLFSFSGSRDLYYFVAYLPKVYVFMGQTEGGE